ncbi:hypothetical protein DV495_000528 [Geotrichum candidum]|nr:hypothetical protein DV495_000528 [Geotrichum candidum]
MASLGALSAGGGSSGGLLSLLTPPGKVPGTGILPLSNTIKETFGHGALDPAVLKVVIGSLPATYGDFPQSDDVAPSAIFIACFSLLALAYYYIFIRDYKRGHRFWAFFGLGGYCVLKVIGFGLRINWSHDVTRVQTSIAATVFTLVSVLFINMLNMLFGHRIFTRRHPETGNASWFNIGMTITYLVVMGVIVMAIVGQAIPFIYFLDSKHLKMCQHVVQAASILQVLYAFAGILLIVTAYAIPPGKIDHRLFFKGPKETLPKTFSATWIESCSPFYFPTKGSQQIIHRGDPQAKYIRVIPSNEAPAGGFADHNDDHPNGPSIRTAIILIIGTSLILSISSAFRCASTFILVNRGGYPGVPFGNWIFHNWVLYIFGGAFEVIVNVLFLVYRADLRFYIPDKSLANTNEVSSDLTVDQTTTGEAVKPETSHFA